MTSGCALTGPATKLKARDTISNSKTETETETKAESKLQCTQILKFSQAGEHKSAVDLADKLIKNGCKCSDKVSQRIDFSRSQLKQADAYVLEAMKRKKEGKLIEAQTNLLKALEIYPKYYWARNLLKKVECSINAQITGLKEEAHNLESDGNLDGALSLIQDAIALSPGDNNLKLEATRLQEAMNILLQEEKKRKQFTLDQRRSIIRKGLVAAQEAEQKDDLESAAGHTIHILELSSAGEPLTPEIVEFARLLGLKLFSTGDFSKAQNLWKEALHLAPGNAKLQKYLAEVEESLDNLKKIQPTPPRLS